MSKFFWSLFSAFVRFLLSLRYRVKVEGGEALEEIRKKGSILFLPNHVAYIDPIILFFYFWPRFHMRPLVVEYVYRMGGAKFWMDLVRAISVPDFDTSVNQYKIYKAEQSLEEVKQGLARGENFILYPSGRLKQTGRERIAGASGAHAIVKNCSDIQIVLMRVSGLWGSSFSHAVEGSSMTIAGSLVKGIKALIKNGFFFLPRREVRIECEIAPPELQQQESRLDFNRFLENWYNRYPAGEEERVDSEPLKLVSYSFWKNDIPTVKEVEKNERENHAVTISPETSEKVYEAIRRIMDRPQMEIEPEMDLASDLGMDSLNMAELIACLSQHFEIRELHPGEINTVHDILQLAEGGGAGQEEKKEENASAYHWPQEAHRPSPALPRGKTIPEAFLRSSQRMGGYAACADDMRGVLSYKKLKQAVLVLASSLKKLPGERVGILLPSSVGAYVTILAVQFAGKIPVMLNWTLGSRYLDEMAARTELEVVLTSWNFLERLQHVEFGKIMEKFQFLEDIRKELTVKDKLKGALISFASPAMILRAYGIDRINPDDPCVILFTSGTEAVPKGVPLSHANVISNLRAAMQCLELKNSDVLYAVLPPFHSFGFSVAGLFSILAGMRIAMFPDPTDSFALANGIQRWQATLFCSPPSFLKGLFRVAKKEQLTSVRWFVSGAEKAPPELFEKVEEMGTNAKLIEGYGITECSPIISLSRPNGKSKGVGEPLPGIDLCTIHLETQELLPPHTEGEICIRGLNVFHGYLGNPRSAFIEIDGKEWYRTGDIGYLDEENFLILSGRLKRFTKVAGEMISLGAVEEAIRSELIREGKISADAPALALCSKELEPGKTALILFSILPLERDKVNEILKRAGFSRLIKIAAIQLVPEIPLMGSGKTDYRRLQTQIA